MFKFFGSKLTLAPTYPAPQYDTIIEPFAGSAAYSVLHRRTPNVTLIDLDERVVALWHRLLSTPVADLLATPDPEPGERSDDLLVAFAAGRTTRDTPDEFVVSPRMSQRYRAMVNRIAGVLDECRHFKVIHGHYSDAPNATATWFIDPPYQPTGTGRWDRTRGGRYLHSNRELDFEALGAWTRDRQGQVIACDQEGADWLPWNQRTSARNGTHATYSEVWWHRSDMGAPPAEPALFDVTYPPATTAGGRDE